MKKRFIDWFIYFTKVQTQFDAFQLNHHQKYSSIISFSMKLFSLFHTFSYICHNELYYSYILYTLINIHPHNHPPTQTQIHTYTYMYICIYIYVYICICLCTHVCICMYVCVCMYPTVCISCSLAFSGHVFKSTA